MVYRTNAYDQSSERLAVDKEDGADEFPGGPHDRGDDSSGAADDPSARIEITQIHASIALMTAIVRMTIRTAVLFVLTTLPAN